MYMITYKVVKTRGLEETYDSLKDAQAKLKKLQDRYIGTKFEIRKMVNNNVYKYMNGGEVYNAK